MELSGATRNDVAKIKVIGVGGGGGNAVDNMINLAITGVGFVAANTDHQALTRSKAPHKVQLGRKVTKGLGAGANPEVGREAALESSEEIRELVRDCDMIFITAGMGGGTGTGAAPIIAQIAKEECALTVGVVTKPFYFEGKKRREQAEGGINEFRTNVDSLIIIPNDRLLSFAPKKATFVDMLKKVDEVLYFAVKGISDLITIPGIINLDFADLRTIMCEKGLAMMGSGTASGETRARDAASKAMSSPLLEDVSITGARGVLINISCGPDLTIEEIHEAASSIQEVAHEDATIMFGTVLDMNASGELNVTLIATGINTSTTIESKTLESISVFRSKGKLTTLPNSRTIKPANLQLQPAPITRQPNSRRSSSTIPIEFTEDNLAIPTYLRYQERTGQQAENTATAIGKTTKFQQTDYNSIHNIRVKRVKHDTRNNAIWDEDILEIPSFIRRQAD